MFSYRNPDRPTRDEAIDQTDIHLNDLFAEAMQVEEWDLDKAMAMARQAYLRGAMDAVNEFAESLTEKDTDQQIRPPESGNESTSQ